MKKFFIVITLFISSCATNPFISYNDSMSDPINKFKYNDIKEAESSISFKQDVLYYLEYATLLRIDNSYLQSNENFTKAQQYIDKWVMSINNTNLGKLSNSLKSGIINDLTTDYEVKDYEKVMLPTYKALNYLAINDIDSARIEVTRMYNIEDIIKNYRELQYAKAQEDAKNNNLNITSLLYKFETQNRNKYNFNQINAQNVLALKNSYENAFSHYLAGYIFEMLGEYSLSRPGYLRALELNPDNQIIKNAINNLDNKNNVKGRTDLLIIEEVGNIASLKSTTLPIPLPPIYSQCFSVLSIAIPQIIDNFDNYITNFSIDNKEISPTLFTDFNLMEARFIHDSLPTIFINNLIRVVKDIAIQQLLCKQAGGLISLATGVGDIFLSKADDRAWLTLPHQIYIHRTSLPYGSHILSSNSRSLALKLNKPYEIVVVRIIGSNVYFMPEKQSFNEK